MKDEKHYFLFDNDKIDHEKSISIFKYKQRDLVQDIAKAIAIFLVVYGHMYAGMKEAGQIHTLSSLHFINFLIYTTHMPIFFLFAGYNSYRGLKSYSVQHYLNRKFWSIVYPYFVWSGVYVAMKSMLSSQVNHQLGLLDLFTIPYKPINFFWFLYALMLMHFVAVMLRNTKIILGVIAVSSFVLVSFVPFLFPGVLRRAAINLPFFYFGLFMAHRGVLSSPSLLSRPFFLLILAFFFYVGGWEVYKNDIFNQPPIILPLTIAGICLIIGISALIAKTRFSNRLAQIGRLSMVIFLTHIIFTAGTRITLKKIGVDGISINLILGTFAGMILPMILHAMVMRAKLESWAGLSGKSPLQHV